MDTRHGGKAVIASGGLADPEPTASAGEEQEELFDRDALADAPLFVLSVDQRGNDVQRGGGRGRPKGSQNRTTEQMRRLFLSRHRDPLMAAGEIISTPIDVLRTQLGCDMLEAAEFWRKVLVDVLPYIHQKRPIAIEGGGVSAGVLNVIIGTPGGNPAGGEFGVSMRLVDGEQNQPLSDDQGEQSHDEAPHVDDK